jgi:hypothetical protein
VPAGHGVHVEAPAAENWPGQAVHELEAGTVEDWL